MILWLHRSGFDATKEARDDRFNRSVLSTARADYCAQFFLKRNYPTIGTVQVAQAPMLNAIHHTLQISRCDLLAPLPSQYFIRSGQYPSLQPVALLTILARQVVRKAF